MRPLLALVKGARDVDDAWLASIDAMNEADRPGRPHASQAAVDRLNAARRGGWATPSYCSACHKNHPGACGCPCHLPAAALAAAGRVTEAAT